MRQGNIIRHLINAAIFIILEIAALNMLSHNGQLQNAWFSKGIQGFMGTIWGGTQQIKDYFHLRKANDALAQENFELRMRIEQMEALLPEESLGEDLAENISDNYRYIPAKIAKISNE